MKKIFVIVSLFSFVMATSIAPVVAATSSANIVTMGDDKDKKEEKKDKIDSELGASLMKPENTIMAKPPVL
jgi:hypothetical protein